MVRGRREQRVPGRLAIHMGMHIDPAGRHQLARGIDLAPARAQSTAEGAVKAEVLPEFVEGEDVAVGERRFIGNV